MAIRKYDVVVTRLQPQSASFTVEAYSLSAAKQHAEDTCGDHEFESSGDAYDEEVESCIECDGSPAELTLQELIDRVLEEIKRDVDNEDLTAVEELLKHVPPEVLRGFIPEDSL